jgi:hypothetical protein
VGSSFANSRLIKIAALPKRAFELAARLERNLLLQKDFETEGLEAAAAAYAAVEAPAAEAQPAVAAAATPFAISPPGPLHLSGPRSTFCLLFPLQYSICTCIKKYLNLVNIILYCITQFFHLVKVLFLSWDLLHVFPLIIIETYNSCFVGISSL